MPDACILASADRLGLFQSLIVGLTNELNKRQESVFELDNDWIKLLACWADDYQWDSPLGACIHGTTAVELENNYHARFSVFSKYAQFWGTPVGATKMDLGNWRDYNLAELFAYGDDHIYHSGEFRGPYWRHHGYWDLVKSLIEGADK